MTIPIIYFAHPVGAPTLEGVAANLASARRWLALLLEVWTDVALCAPWLPYLDVLEDTGANRARGLRDDLAIARRCDGIVMCGPALSHGMSLELDAVRERRGMVLDLVGVDLDDHAAIVDRVQRATAAALEQLEELRRACVQRPAGGH